MGRLFLERTCQQGVKASICGAREEGYQKLFALGENAPGGGVFDGGILGPTTINDEGDVATNFGLSPFSFPIGLNCGTFLFSQNTGALSAIVLPGETSVPGGGKFAGVFFGPTINNRGHIVFPGIVPTDQGIHIPTEDYVGFGTGLYLADKKGKISAVVSPGDPAPGGGRFDWAAGPPWLNDRGDVAFCAHIAGEECVTPEFSSAVDPYRLSIEPVCQESLYGRNLFDCARG